MTLFGVQVPREAGRLVSVEVLWEPVQLPRSWKQEQAKQSLVWLALEATATSPTGPGRWTSAQ